MQKFKIRVIINLAQILTLYIKEKFEPILEILWGGSSAKARN